MQNWDFFGTKFGLWSHLGPSPKFGTSLEGLPVLSASYFPPWADSLYFWGESWERIKFYFISHHKHLMLVPNPGLLSGKFTLSEIQLWPVTGAGGFLKHGVTLSLIKSLSSSHHLGRFTHSRCPQSHSLIIIVVSWESHKFITISVPGSRRQVWSI